ncbi:hypothetical protein B0T25DRAFT_536561 [Lasiosphaeria hispida]|uniref:Uncharacterized protein n=1 Tax=Lasiosphaeria hispida TaxID=260671 RepID=A0AAJ0MF41_9PEZI|nr:hypothetical protein B0T25DRAFT_536561 [Lasiosphaeria hispida]
MLDSAIPEHLRCSRTRPAKLTADFKPPYPSYSVRFPEDFSQLVMAIVGAQYKTASDADGAA